MVGVVSENEMTILFWVNENDGVEMDRVVVKSAI